MIQEVITRAVRHRVEVSPPFFFVFFFLVAVVLRVRYANAEPTFLKAQPRSQWHPRIKPRFVQYIYTSLLLK